MRLLPDCCFFRISKTAIAVLSLIVCSVCHTAAEPQSLSEADRIALEEKLQKIQERSKERVGGLFRKAIQDYRRAIQSDSATMELYIKCIEKVQFTDEKRKSSEFREWKRKHKERLSSASMRMALRHQLAWLLLSIEAAQHEDDLSEMGSRAIAHLDQIMNNAEVLREHKKILSENSLNSVFAKAYKLNIKIKDWPSSAMDIRGIYDKVVMPPLRNVTKINSLREAWKKRILHEGYVIEKWNIRKTKRIGMKDTSRPPEFEKFLSEKRPELLWNMEVDCFKAGDERASALHMLKHLEAYITHKNAPNWITAFQDLIHPEVEEETDQPDASTSQKGL